MTKVLYPNDSSPAGKQLRLEQQAFFVSCALQDCIRLLLLVARRSRFRRQVRHPDQRHPPRAGHRRIDAAAGRRSPVALGRGLGHHLAGVQLHQSHAAARGAGDLAGGSDGPAAAEAPGDHLRDQPPLPAGSAPAVSRRRARVGRMSLIDERGRRSVRMVHLATVGSHRVNGVATLHTQLLRKNLLPDFAEMYPERFVNVTNGVSPRRFLALANPGLARLIDSAIGGDWVRDLDRLRALEPLADDPEFPRALAQRQAEQQAGTGALAGGASRPARPQADRSGRAAGRPLQAFPRVQAPASEPAAHHCPVASPAAAARTTAWCRAPSCSRARLHLATGWPSSSSG